MTQAVMVDPVVLVSDGQTYERAEILAWLEQHCTSPVSGERLASKDIVPNHALRCLIRSLAAL